MSAAQADIEEVLRSLAATPRAITSLTQGLTTTRLHSRPDKDTWSANEILAHLRACADVWGKSILSMIAQDHPTIRYVSPRTWIRKTTYVDQQFPISLATFKAQRAELLKTLRALRATDWSRGATFTATTSGREGTILSYALRIADHEAQHLAQLQRILK